MFFLAAALFFSVFEQAGSTLNLFADRATRNTLLGYPFPSSWYQSLNALFIIIFAPVFAWLWIKMGPNQPASPTKFSFGLIGVGLGFLILVPAARWPADGVQVSPMWLTATYLIHTFAELCLSPVGLSSMTKLAPARIVSLMMGVWFLGASVGNFLGGQAASFYESMPLAQLFGMVALLPIAAGIVMFLFRRPLTASSATAWRNANDGARGISNASATSARRRSRRARSPSAQEEAARAFLLRPEASRQPSALRLPPRTQRRPAVVGGAERARRSIPRPSGSRCTSKIIRSTTASSKASFPKATAPAS